MPEVGDGQGGLAYCNPGGRKELDTTERLNWTELRSLRGMMVVNKDSGYTTTFIWVPLVLIQVIGLKADRAAQNAYNVDLRNICSM